MASPLPGSDSQRKASHAEAAAGGLSSPPSSRRKGVAGASAQAPERQVKQAEAAEMLWRRWGGEWSQPGRILEYYCWDFLTAC